MTIISLSEAVEVLKIFSQANFNERVFENEESVKKEDNLKELKTHEINSDNKETDRESQKKRIENLVTSEEYQTKYKVDHLETLLGELTRSYKEFSRKGINSNKLQELRSRIHDCKRKIHILKSKN